MNFREMDDLIGRGLKEDIPYYDITSENLIDSKLKSIGKIISKEAGIICGTKIFSRVFEILDENINVNFFKNDGDQIEYMEEIGEIRGSTINILAGERVALNLLQKATGIATHTRKMVDEISNTNCFLVDTRKTTPGLRDLEKYAVRMGGGRNHRFSLSDGIMIKDNHIAATGSITAAIEKIREKKSHIVKIEVEVENIDEFNEALKMGADIIMLDNMSVENIEKAVQLNGGKAILEASGNVTMDNIKKIAETGVNVISCGAITHSSKSHDISLKISKDALF